MLANIHERTGGSNRKTEAIDVSLRSTITLAPRCHERVTRNQLQLEVLDEALGFNGPVRITGKLATGEKLQEPYISQPVLTGAWRTHERE